MTLINNRVPFLYHIKLCALFWSHQWIQTWVTIRKRSIRVKIGDFLSHVILKFGGCPWKRIGHIFYAASSFVCHFIAISEFKLELQSGHAHSESKSMILLSLCDLEIWRRTLKNNRAPLLYYFKLCATFRSREWIQTGVTVRKRPIRVKINDIFSPVTLTFDR